MEASLGPRRAALGERVVPVAVLVLVAATAACTADSAASGEPSPPQPGVPPAATTSDPTTPEPATPAAAVPADLEPFYTQTLDWGRCEQRSVMLECAMLTVPVDYDDPTGPTMEVALIRIGATRPDPVGSLVVNAGGPGIALVDANWFPPVGAHLRTTFEIVGFDPRGTGRSGGLDCLGPDARQELESLDRTPDTPAEVAALDDAHATHTEACAERAEGRLPFLGTEQVVADLDVLRAALGEERLHYVGYSYGTLLGAEYAARHPDRTGRMALVSPVPAGRLDPLDWGHDRALNAEAALDRALEYCLETPDCPLGEDLDDARTRLETFLQDLDERPLDADGVVLTRDRAVDSIGATLGGGSEAWAELRRALEAAYRGHPVLLHGLAEPGDTDWPDAQHAVLCLDSPRGSRQAEAAELAPVWADEAPVFGEQLAWGLAGACDGWPTASFEPAPRPADVELLLVHSEGDPWSPPADAERMAEELPEADRVVYTGPEHISYFASACVREAVDSYLMDGPGPEVLICPDGWAEETTAP